jgi:hypothetical protein
MVRNTAMEVKTNFNINKETNGNTWPGQPARSRDFVLTNESVNKLINEGGEGFYNYIDSLGLIKDSNLIVLSSRHHYYYDSEEMNNAETVVNLKELNRIKELKSLLHSHLHFLPHKCNYVGCFVNNRKIEKYSLRKNLTLKERTWNSDDVEYGIASRNPFINMLYGLMDSKTNTHLSETDVTLLMEDNGFKVIDLTEFNGVTFFHSKKVSNTFN